jgi:hypothetical protein
MNTPIHPKTGQPGILKAQIKYKGMQIAPPDSLAYRIEPTEKGMSFEWPKVAELQREFFDHRKPGCVAKDVILRKVRSG